MVRVTETSQPHVAGVPSVPFPLVWISQLKAWFLDTSRLGGVVIPCTTCENNIIWPGKGTVRDNLMINNMTHAATQRKVGFNNSKYQQRVFNNQTSNTGGSIFGVNLSDHGSSLYHNQAYAMNASNSYNSTWPSLRTCNEKASGQLENFCSDAIRSQCNLTNTYGFQGVQRHGSIMDHGLVPRVPEDIREEVYGPQCHPHQREFGLNSHLEQPTEKFYEYKLFEPADPSRFGNQVGDSRYCTDNSLFAASFLPQHATQTSHSQLSRSGERVNGIFSDLYDRRGKMDEQQSVEKSKENFGNAVYIDEQQKYYLPSAEQLGEELGFVETTDDYDTGSSTEDLEWKPMTGR